MGRLALWGVQLWCWLSHGFNHPWGRELDLHRHIALYENTVIRACERCGASKLFPV